LFKGLVNPHRQFEDLFQRDLTYDIDVLKALAGFSRRFSVLGLPILFSDSVEYAIGLPEQLIRFSTEYLTLAIALSWNIRATVVQRLGLPTWTCAGWKPASAATWSSQSSR
jgi:hypothetical protein